MSTRYSILTKAVAPALQGVVVVNKTVFSKKDVMLAKEYMIRQQAAEFVVELKVNCWQSDLTGDWWTRSKARECRSCGSKFHMTESDADENRNYCSEQCELLSTSTRNLSLKRQDYCTDVVQEKGFGATSHKINEHNIYCGIELEVDVILEKGVVNAFNNTTTSYCIKTRDGSLDDHSGCEFIFNPQGLEEQKENVYDFLCRFGNLIKTERDHDEQYGMHIHITRYMDNSCAKRIQFFANAHSGFYKKIGGRDLGSYSRKYIADSFSDYDDERYNMVNITNDRTIEFRYPDSGKGYEHICANIELAWATCLFVYSDVIERKATVYKRSDSLEAFINWVKENKDTYPNLAAGI